MILKIPACCRLKGKRHLLRRCGLLADFTDMAQIDADVIQVYKARQRPSDGHLRNKLQCRASCYKVPIDKYIILNLRNAILARNVKKTIRGRQVCSVHLARSLDPSVRLWVTRAVVFDNGWKGFLIRWLRPYRLLIVIQGLDVGTCRHPLRFLPFSAFLQDPGPQRFRHVYAPKCGQVGRGHRWNEAWSAEGSKGFANAGPE